MASIETNGLTPLEIASSVLTGPDDAGDAREPAAGRSARTALEESLLRALLRPPCVVGFSGGRDSSALLACAMRVARREGLPAPLPVTLTFAAAPQSREEDWQELMLRHLGSTDRISREFGDELDLVGPVAERVMALEGLPYPYNLHLLWPLIDEASGGSFVTGLGGDQALHPAGRRLDVLARRVRPAPRDVARIAVDVGPRAIRRRVLRGRVGLEFPWLRTDANARLSREWLEDQVRLPFRWDRQLGELWRSRFMRLTVRRITALGNRADVLVHHPFAETDFVFALAREAGATGFASRTAAMNALFADVLPAEVIRRPTKASFDEVLFNRHARAFVDGLGEDTLERLLADLDLDTIVDPRALAAHWAGGEPLANSFLLLQACWLADTDGVGGGATAEPPHRPAPARGILGSARRRTP